MSSLIKAYKNMLIDNRNEANMLIDNRNEANMLIAFDTDKVDIPEPPEHDAEWKLVVRDYPNSSQFNDAATYFTESAGDFGTPNDVGNPFSRLHSLYTNTNDFQGLTTYECLWIPYLTTVITPENRKDPNDTDTFIHWFQDINPLKTDDPATEEFNFQFIDSANEGGISIGTGNNQFYGLSLSPSPVAVMDGNGKYQNFYLSCGTSYSYGTNGIAWFNNQSIKASELYIRSVGEEDQVIISPDLSYQLNHQFSQTIGDLSLSSGIEEYHQGSMIKLKPNQVLSKTFADNSVLLQGDNLTNFTVRVKVFAENGWRISGHGSWSFEYQSGVLKFYDGANSVVSNFTLINQFNDFVVVVNPDFVTFYVNGSLHEAKTNICNSPLNAWSIFKINDNISTNTIYEGVRVKLGINDTPQQIYDDYVGNITKFFLHNSITASHVLDTENFTTTLTNEYIVEPATYLQSQSQKVFTTPNSTVDVVVENSGIITVPNTQNRIFNLTYTFSDSTTHTVDVTETLFDSSEPNKTLNDFSPTITASEYLLENSYRVDFHLDTTTQSFIVPVESLNFSYNNDVRLTNGTFTTLVNPITTSPKTNNQAISINNYAGSKIPIGYYQFNISDKNVKTLNASSTLIQDITQTGGTNIVQLNTKQISVYRNPYIRLNSQTNAEQITRVLYFEKQDFVGPITSIVVNWYLKTTNFNLVNLTPQDILSAINIAVKPGYDTNQQLTFTYPSPVVDLNQIFTMITDQTTQMIYQDDVYMELVAINGIPLDHKTSVYIEPFTYIPTLRFSAISIQNNQRVETNVYVNKNEDLITGFKIRYHHPSNAIISADTFGILGFTISSTTLYTDFIFSGSNFNTQQDTLIKIIAARDNPYETFYPSDLSIEIMYMNLANTPTPILQNTLINPSFTYSTQSAVSFEDFSFQIIDFDSETVSMNAYLNTNRDVKTELTIWVDFLNENGYIGAPTFGFGAWNFNVNAETREYLGVTYNGFKLTATSIPNISDSKQLLFTVTSRRFRSAVFMGINHLTVIDSITPNTNLMYNPNTTIHETITRYRDTELNLRPQQVSNQIHIPVDLRCANTIQTWEIVFEVWFSSKVNFVEVTTIHTNTFSSITSTPTSGSYKGFVSGYTVTFSSGDPATYIEGSIYNMLSVILDPYDTTAEIDSNDFAVKFVSQRSDEPLAILIEDTHTPAFNYTTQVAVTGRVIQITEGEYYKLSASYNHTYEYSLLVGYDVYFNSDKLQAESSQSQLSTLEGVSWGSVHKISKTNYQFNEENFTMKFYREGLIDSDFQIVITSIQPLVTVPPTLTFVGVPSMEAFSYTPEFQIRLSPQIVDDDKIKIIVVLEKDDRPVRNFTFNYLINNDRTITRFEARGLLIPGNYITTDQLNADFSGYGFWSNTNKTVIEYSTTVDGVGLNQSSLEVFYFTITRREVNYLIDIHDYSTNFPSYEAFHTATPYFSLQWFPDKDNVPFIPPELFASDLHLTTTSPNNHRLTFNLNHAGLGADTTLIYRVFYRNMYLRISPLLNDTKTELTDYAPYETAVGFKYGFQITITGSSSYQNLITHNFVTDTVLTDHITQDDFLIEIVNESFISLPEAPYQGLYNIPIKQYIPDAYIEPAGFVIPPSPQQVFVVSTINETNYPVVTNNVLTQIHRGVKNTDQNDFISVNTNVPTEIHQTGAFNMYSLNGVYYQAHMEFPMIPSYDYLTDGVYASIKSFLIYGGDTVTHIAGHSGIFEIVVGGFLSAFVLFNGVYYPGEGERVRIVESQPMVLKARVYETASNTYNINLQSWYFNAGAWVLLDDYNKTVTSTVTSNPTTAPHVIKTDNPYITASSYNLLLYYADYTVGKLSDTEYEDMYFRDQIQAAQEPDTNVYALLDLRKADWEADWNQNGSTYPYSTIGLSRSFNLTDNFLTKNTFQTGSELWGDAMRVGLILVFKTTTEVPIEQLCLFIHGMEKSPPYPQLIVNRNGFDNAMSVELNENNASLQQQHLDKIKWEKPGYEYLYYAKVNKRASTSSQYDLYDIESRLIGLNNIVNETFTSSAWPQFLKTSSSSSTDFAANLYVGRTILPEIWGGFGIGYLRYFEYVSETHSEYQINRVKRDWSHIKLQ